MIFILTRLFLSVAALGLVACASLNSTYYKPEIEGPNAKWSHGTVIYSIPNEDKPLLKMHVASAVQPKNKNLHVRMFFVRKQAGAGEYLDPQELTLTVPDSTKVLTPAHVHANGAGKPLIRLTDQPRQAVELSFAVPKDGDEYPFVKLNWKIHYQKNGRDTVTAGSERFDYVDKSELQRGVGQYQGSLEFPAIGEAPDPEWYPNGWMWW